MDPSTLNIDQERQKMCKAYGKQCDKCREVNYFISRCQPVAAVDMIATSDVCLVCWHLRLSVWHEQQRGLAAGGLGHSLQHSHQQHFGQASPVTTLPLPH